MSKKSALITADYEELSITFTGDGWFNATLVAEKYGKRPNDWLVLPSTKQYTQALEGKYPGIKLVITKKGGDNKTITRKSGNGGTWLHPKLGVRFAQWLDINFAIWCDEQIDLILRGDHPHHHWTNERAHVATEFSAMNEALQLVRSEQGKDTETHHYTNEARLVNWAFCGEFKALERDGMNNADLKILRKIESRNHTLIAMGKPYEERKAQLFEFAEQLKAKAHGRKVVSLADVRDKRDS